MINLREVYITQNGVRNIDQIHEMTNYLHTHEYFEWVLKPIIINDVDGDYFVTDGHHRCLAKILANILYLNSSEYIIKKYSLAEFEEINLDNNWVTPFNPWTELRLSDLSKFKEKINKLHTEEEIVNFIQNNSTLFKTKRNNINTFWDLAHELHLI